MTKLTSLMGTFLITLCAPLAHADFVIGYSLNGGAVQPCADSANDDVASCFTAGQNIGGGVTLTNLSGTSNSPGTSAFSDQFGSTTTITTTSSAATIVLYYAAQDFTLPITTPYVLDYASNISITSAEPGSSGTVALESCVDQSNGTVPAPVGTGFCATPAKTLTNTVLGVPATIGGSASNTVTGLITSLSAPYSLSQEVTLTLGKNTSLNLSASQDLTPVPEPASLLLLGSGLLGLGVVVRRKIQSKRA
jgi:hypothetical protein